MATLDNNDDALSIVSLSATNSPSGAKRKMSESRESTPAKRRKTANSDLPLPPGKEKVDQALASDDDQLLLGLLKHRKELDYSQLPASMQPARKEDRMILVGSVEDGGVTLAGNTQIQGGEELYLWLAPSGSDGKGTGVITKYGRISMGGGSGPKKWQILKKDYAKIVFFPLLSFSLWFQKDAKLQNFDKEPVCRFEHSWLHASVHMAYTRDSEPQGSNLSSYDKLLKDKERKVEEARKPKKRKSTTSRQDEADPEDEARDPPVTPLGNAAAASPRGTPITEKTPALEPSASTTREVAIVEPDSTVGLPPPTESALIVQRKDVDEPVNAIETATIIEPADTVQLQNIAETAVMVDPALNVGTACVAESSTGLQLNPPSGLPPDVKPNVTTDIAFSIEMDQAEAESVPKKEENDKKQAPFADSQSGSADEVPSHLGCCRVCMEDFNTKGECLEKLWVADKAEVNRYFAMSTDLVDQIKGRMEVCRKNFVLKHEKAWLEDEKVKVEHDNQELQSELGHQMLEIQKLKAEHKEEVEALNTAHKAEINSLHSQHGDALERLQGELGAKYEAQKMNTESWKSKAADLDKRLAEMNEELKDERKRAFANRKAELERRRDEAEDHRAEQERLKAEADLALRDLLQSEPEDEDSLFVKQPASILHGQGDRGFGSPEV